MATEDWDYEMMVQKIFHAIPFPPKKSGPGCAGYHTQQIFHPPGVELGHDRSQLYAPLSGSIYGGERGGV